MSKLIEHLTCYIIKCKVCLIKADLINKNREFPGGLVVKILGFHCRGPSSIPGRGTEILQAAWRGKKQKQNKTEKQVGASLVHSGWESACQCRGHGFEPWSGKIPHATEQLSPCATTTEPAL